MIRIDRHGRQWIMKQISMEDNYCPECNAPPMHINEDRPQESKTEYWFDCECGRCGCQWVVKYEPELRR